ncbi:MAG TPA: MFS transporter, partial [Solirubrobacteraceae bacterium]|nr:MFS transporter [Solirubrobacteraceae bacterium]
MTSAVRRRPRLPLPAVLRREPRYRLLFAGQSLSVIGDRITYVALAFAVLEIGTVADLGWVTAAAALPFLVVALPGGALSDRLGRRRVMLVADLVRAATQATTAVLLLSGAAQPWMLVVLMACFGTADAFFGPALNGLIPQTVGAARVQEANALLGLAANIGMIAGPLVAAALIAVWSPGGAIAIDAATFLVSAACLWRLRPAEIPAARDEEPHDLVHGLREGWAIVRATGWMIPGLLALVAYHVLVLPSVFVLGPEIARTTLHGATSWGFITAGFGVGAACGSIAAMRLKPLHTLRAAFTAMLVASLQGVFIASGLGTAGIAALEVLAGAGVALLYTLWETTIQEQIPSEAIARVAAYDWATSVGLMPVGLALAGPVGAAIG